MRIKLEHQNIFFASDYHQGHENVIKFDKRPFKDINEMDEVLINNWNKVVEKDSIVFYLGDLSMRSKIEKTKWFVEQLNGKIHFILGNHDKEKEIRKLNRFESISDYIHLEVKDDENPRKYQEIMMMHYPILQWNKSHYGAIHLHGHSHMSLMKNPEFDWYYKRKVLDIGCNGHNYTPLSYQQIKDIMLNKGIEKIDHHE